MEKEVFSLKEVGLMYNANFINYRADAERGWGLEIKEKYGVDAYPTFLFVNGDGVLIFRSKGYNPDPAAFIMLGDIALQQFKSKLTINDLKSMYDGGNRDKAFLVTYIEKLKELQMEEEAKGLMDQYLEMLQPAERMDTANAVFFLKHVTLADSKVFDFILEHQALFLGTAMDDATIWPEIIRPTKEEKLAVILANAVIESVFQAKKKQDRQLLEQVAAKAERIASPSIKFPYTLFSFRMQFYVTARDTAAIINEAKSFFAKRHLDSLLHKPPGENDISMYLANILNMTAGMFAVYASTATDMEQAILWGTQALTVAENEPRFLNTLSHLYYKSGRKEKAIELQRSAIYHASQRKELNKDEIERYQSELELML
jgi:hypothetical protein